MKFILTLLLCVIFGTLIGHVAYLDGRVKELDAEIKKVRLLHDDLAFYVHNVHGLPVGTGSPDGDE